MRGRIGCYPPDVVDRVEQVKELHAEGFTLELIARMLDAGGGAVDETKRPAATLRGPYGRAMRAEPRPERRFTDIGAALEELGLSADDIGDATARIRAHLESIAEILAGIVNRARRGDRVA